ncbi:hypothetical protein [Solimicrobium silvestre]|uniref:Uncharacterized protein n=1 Tax=Solimicrobium silvestre TaxID=2099400 RepID=A0A2S9GW71_9BURK|nr:hypothetical protein [Solimicrobium silvestre]PRC91951.1 hypothetical protein S2091_3293 [Solimicrobium silvestre]
MNRQLTLYLPNPLAARVTLFLSTKGQPLTTCRSVDERLGKNHKSSLKNLNAVMAATYYFRLKRQVAGDRVCAEFIKNRSE